MKIQLYPTIKSKSYETKEKQIDPVTKMIDEFFKKDIDKSKNTDYNNYINKKRGNNYE